MPDKSENKPSWWIQLIILPIVISLVITIIARSIMDVIYEKEREISYFKDYPIALCDNDTNNIKIILDDKEASKVFLQRVLIWNSGDLYIKSFKVCCTFDMSENFKILGVKHVPNSYYNRNNIQETRSEFNLREFKYSEFHSDCKDNIIFLINNNPNKDSNLDIKIMSAEDFFEVKKIESESKNKFINIKTVIWFLAISGIVIAFISALIIRALTQRFYDNILNKFSNLLTEKNQAIEKIEKSQNDLEQNISELKKQTTELLNHKES